MSWTCPLCGYQNEETTMRCMCGFEADESVLRLSEEQESADIFGGKEGTLETPLSSYNTVNAVYQQPSKDKNIKAKDEKQNTADDEIIFKEIDSWRISFSTKDHCVYLSTPALQSFRLKLTIDDLKALFDFISEKANIDIATRKRLITGNEMAELVEMLERMIEVKKTKFKIKFSDDELQGIADIINKKLKE